MPTVATVDGVKIVFYPDEHPPPHFHAKYAEFVAQIRISPVQVLKGSLPPNKVANVLKWTAEHQGELLASWNALAAGQKPGKIK
jgi:hypothetical protein